MRLATSSFRRFVGSVPALRNLAHFVGSFCSRVWFKSSREYWESRYRDHGTSGDGSVGRLAEFKAQIVNDCIQRYAIQTVLEYGCGDGDQLSLLKVPQYRGYDVSRTVIERCRARFNDDQSKTFSVLDAENSDDQKWASPADATLSLDVLYHLVEDEVFCDYMRRLFRTAKRFVIIYSTNEIGKRTFAHVRHRRFTDFVASEFPDWKLIEETANPYPAGETDTRATSNAGFFIYARSM